MPTPLQALDDPAANQPEANCSLIGYQFRLPDAALRRLYPTHAAYVSKVAEDLARLRAQGWVTPDDAEGQLLEAVHADVP